MKKLEDYVVSIPDFPKKGIIFRDVTSVLQDADGFSLAVERMKQMVENVDFDVVVGAEARGFIFAARLQSIFIRVWFRFEKQESCPGKPSLRATSWNMGKRPLRFIKTRSVQDKK